MLRSSPMLRRKTPHSPPFVLPKIGDEPWTVPPPPHESAWKYWRGGVATKLKDARQTVAPHAWLPCALRFISTGDLAYAWHHFGGPSAQLPHLSIILHHAVTETAAYAISYDSALRLLFHRIAPQRSGDTDFAKLLREEDEEDNRQLKTEFTKTRTSHPTRNHRAAPRGHRPNSPHRVTNKGRGQGFPVDQAIPQVGVENWRPMVDTKGTKKGNRPKQESA